MIESLVSVDEPGVIESSCLLRGSEVLSSTFPADKRNHETVGRKAFSYIFTYVSKLRSKHDEAHLEIGDKRLSGFVIQPDMVLICLSDKSCSVVKVRNHVNEVRMNLQSEA